MIWDCFTFFNEVDVVEIRVRELASLPDLKHVAVVSDLDHRGREAREPRDAVAELNGRLGRLRDRLYVYCGEMPRGHLYPRERESFQRNRITAALAAFGATESHVVVVSDADEVPRAEAVLRYENGIHGIHALMMSQHCYWLDGVVRDEVWSRARIMRRRDMEWGGCPDHIRLSVQYPAIDHAGWHFSWMGGVDAVRKKLSTFSHREFDTPEMNDADRIRRAMEGDEQFWDHKKLDFRPIDEHFPACVREEPGRWQDLIHGARR